MRIGYRLSRIFISLLALSIIFSVCHGDVQKVKGNCFVSGVVKNVTLLDHCINVYGDLMIDTQDKSQTTLATVEVVKGCVTVINTQLGKLPFKNNLQISCEKPGTNRIMNNKRLCLITNQKTNLEGIDNMVLQIDNEEEDCPFCEVSNMQARCQTVMGNFDVSDSVNFDTHKQIKRIVGQLKVDVKSNEKWSNYLGTELRVDNLDDFDAAVNISGLIPPKNDFLKKLRVKTYGDVALEIDIPGYVLPKDIYLFMKTESLNTMKEISATVEGPKDCLYSVHEDDRPYSTVEDLLYCENIFGTFDINTKDIPNIEHLQTRWIDINTGAPSFTLRGGSEIVGILRKQADFTFSDPNFIFDIYLTDSICLDAKIMDLALKWMRDDDRSRVKFNSETDCTKYIGKFDEYYLRKEDPKKIKRIEGSMSLNISKLSRMKLKDGDIAYDKWNWNFSSFTELKEIRKSLDIPLNEPALAIAMCSTKETVPDWVFNVQMSSNRVRDVLIRIVGPGYKMPQADYAKLAAKYGPERLDIEPMLPGECILNNPVKDLSVLDKCISIIGDLIINGSITGKTMAVIRHVSGCVMVLNSNLDTLEFLQFEVPYDPWACTVCGGKTVIKGNPNLCADHDDFNVLRSDVANNKDGCGNALKKEEVQYRNIIIYGYKNNSDLEESFDHVKEIHGRIMVAGNDFTELDIFPNLTRIVHRGIGPAVVVENNPNLTVFKLPALTKITVFKQKTAMLFRNNPELNFTDSELKFFEKAAGSAKVTIEQKKVEVEEKQEEETVVEERSARATGIGLAIGSGVAIVIIAGYVLFVVVETKVSSRKKKSKKEDSKGKTEKTGKTTKEPKDKTNKMGKDDDWKENAKICRKGSKPSLQPTKSSEAVEKKTSKSSQTTTKSRGQAEKNRSKEAAKTTSKDKKIGAKK